MKLKLKEFQGVTFGMMDAVITILGVMLGLSVVQDKAILFLGVITAGVADSFANAAGFHVSEETENKHTQKEVFEATALAFVSTLITAVILSIPILLLPFKFAIITSVIIGSILLIYLGYFVSKITKKFIAYKLALEYLLLGISVVIISYLLGRLILYFRI